MNPDTEGNGTVASALRENKWLSYLEGLQRFTYRRVCLQVARPGTARGTSAPVPSLVLENLLQGTKAVRFSVVQETVKTNPLASALPDGQPDQDVLFPCGRSVRTAFLTSRRRVLSV